MQLIRRLLMFSAVIVLAVSIVLLLNFTAPNPTGRRYSSEMPSRLLNNFDRGFDAERILSHDLDVPNNNSSLPNAGQCVCNQSYAPDKSPGVNYCNVCLVYSPLVARFNIPDFVTDKFIAEAKDTLLIDARSQEQIRNFALMATELKRPLWLFVSYRTEIHPHIAQLVNATGGEVVPYFTFPGFTDPIDEAAKNALLGGMAFLAFGLAWEYAVYMGRKPSEPKLSPAPEPKRQPPKSPINDAEDLAARSKEKLRIKIDTEDARNDFRE